MTGGAVSRLHTYPSKAAPCVILEGDFLAWLTKLSLGAVPLSGGHRLHHPEILPHSWVGSSLQVHEIQCRVLTERVAQPNKEVDGVLSRRYLAGNVGHLPSVACLGKVAVQGALASALESDAPKDLAVEGRLACRQIGISCDIDALGVLANARWAGNHRVASNVQLHALWAECVRRQAGEAGCQGQGSCQGSKYAATRTTGGGQGAEAAILRRHGVSHQRQESGRAAGALACRRQQLNSPKHAWMK
mmetsp:Transcript_22344/g.61965  ORF Transcript_22344/g.61965 Transcript_22344/m.61965 type:complete len:246 (+) Transcript_22344:104-841(+)